MSAATGLFLSLLAATPVANIGGGNALTLPAQRHLVRVAEPEGPIWLLALQQDGASGHGLVFFRSDDDGRSFQFAAPIQNDPTERDTADLLVVGPDVAVVYSYEGPDLTGSTRHDVYFQWWRYVAATRSFTPSAAVRVFDSSSSSTAYTRAELVRDSLGRLWVQAFRLEPDGTNTIQIAVSTNGGAGFAIQPSLGTVPRRGGGRLVSLGGKLVLLYSMQGSTTPTQLRYRLDSDPLSTWHGPTNAFTEPIYHGAALSTVVTPSGGLHLVYKNAFDERLYHRFFDGQSFGPATRLDDSSDWALQPALVGLGDDLVVFYNHVVATGDSYDFRVRYFHAGAWSAPTVLDGAGDFKGYPASIERLPAGFPRIPVFYGQTANAAVGGSAVLDSVGNPFGGGSPGGETLLFSDSFSVAHPPDTGLGPSWRVVSGLWYSAGYAATDGRNANQANEQSASCANCRLDARMAGFGVPETGLMLRVPSPSSADGYQVILTGTGRLRVTRRRAGVVTVLGEAASGVTDLTDWAAFSVTITGSGPVQIVVKVNDVVRLSITDTSSAAFTASGYAGLWTTNPGVIWDDLKLYREP
jgi:hypothetical protein